MTGRRTIWYTPDAGVPVRVDLGWTWSAASELPTPRRFTTPDALGRPYTLLEGGDLRVQLRRERLAPGDTQRALQTIENHLQRGGRIHFGADRSRAFVAWPRGDIAAGSTTLTLGPNHYEGQMGGDALALAPGDVLVIEGASPLNRRERVAIDTIAPRGSWYTITTTTPTRWAYTEAAGVFVRWEGQYPSLWLPDTGAQLVTDELRSLYTFEAVLQMDGAIYSYGISSGGAMPTGWRSRKMDSSIPASVHDAPMDENDGRNWLA